MKRGRLIIGVALAMGVCAVAVSAASAGGSEGENAGAPGLQLVRDATAQYRDVERATDAGYVQFFGCVHEPLSGAMGIHFVNGALAGDTKLKVTEPEALMYGLQPDGTLSLLGVEYVVFKEAWDAKHGSPPQLFGKPFNVVPAPNRYGLPTFYELHAWAWRGNPTGAHEDWNQKVLCTHTEGHTH
jgi:hypothetical protein